MLYRTIRFILDFIHRLQWLRLALSNGPNWVGLSYPIHLRTETDPVSETLWFLSYIYQTIDKVQNKPYSFEVYCLLILEIVLIVMHLGKNYKPFPCTDVMLVRQIHLREPNRVTFYTFMDPTSLLRTAPVIWCASRTEGIFRDLGSLVLNHGDTFGRRILAACAENVRECSFALDIRTAEPHNWLRVKTLGLFDVACRSKFEKVWTRITSVCFTVGHFCVVGCWSVPLIARYWPAIASCNNILYHQA
jgi:hypothetical protein